MSRAAAIPAGAPFATRPTGRLILSAALALFAGSPALSAGETGPRPDGSIDRFAQRLEEVLSTEGAAGVYQRGCTFGFRLEGYGAVFVSRAVESPLGAPSAYRTLLERLARDPRPAAREIVTEHEVQAASARALERAELRRAKSEAQRIARELAKIPPTGSHDATAFRRMEVSRLEAAVAALRVRLASIERRISKPGTGEEAPVAAEGTPVDRVVDRLVDTIIEKGRELTIRPDERLSIVLLLSPVGTRSAERTVEITVRGSDLPESAEVTEPGARMKVRVLKKRL